MEPSPEVIFPKAGPILGSRPSKTDVTSPPMLEGKIPLIPAFRLLTISPPAALIFGPADLMPDFIAPGREDNTRPIMGMALLNRKVEAVSTRLCMEPVTSPPMAILPKRFWAAAFMAEKEPLKVSLASFAVVPVTPSWFCTAWMALYTSDRLSILYSVPVSFWASCSSRCISSLVPPYPSLRLSSMV